MIQYATAAMVNTK